VPGIGGLIQVRLSSERLPGKALKPICGKPAVVHLLERVYATEALTPDRVVVCTTVDPADDPLVPVVEGTGARVFRGSREDIVDRFYHAVEAFQFDAVIQVDGDDICADPTYMDLCLSRLLADDDTDVVITRGLPLGIGCKAIRGAAFGRVWRAYVPEPNGTSASLYFTASDLCRQAFVDPVSARHRHPRAWVTLDLPEDLRFFEAVFEQLYREGEVFGVEEIVDLVTRHPELLELNGHAFSAAYAERSLALIDRERPKYRTPDGAIHEIVVPGWLIDSMHTA
jgi:spore coat polysaccharide biosynthesis protein SpsF